VATDVDESVAVALVVTEKGAEDTETAAAAAAVASRRILASAATAAAAAAALVDGVGSGAPPTAPASSSLRDTSPLTTGLAELDAPAAPFLAVDGVPGALVCR